MSNLPAIVIDGNFDNPFEIEGSPTFTVDEITYSLIVTRRYAVLKTAYKPIPQMTPDSVYKGCYLVNEISDSAEGPILKFHRVYAQLPSTRLERRLISFTFPGRSATYYSQLTALPIGWNKYGVAPPVNRLILALVIYQYTLGPPLALSTQLSKITYQGQEVDFLGEVFVPVGNVPILGNQTEPRYSYQGETSPMFMFYPWIVSMGSRRWMGPIWETETVEVIAPY
jgi:hypothetical protein